MAEAYSHLSIHRWMLRDSIRNEAYRVALARVVRPGDVVIDVGAGTGIMSIFAAQAGAAKVYAVERTEIAAVARRLIERNGFADRIEVVEGDLEDADIPGSADVIVSEWMGGFGVDENMLAPVVIARRRWLRPGGCMVPGAVTAVLAPAFVEALAEDQRHWRSRPHGVNLDLVAELTADETVMSQCAVDPEDLLASPQPMWRHDASTCTLEEADSPFEARLSFVATRAGSLTALAAWFDAEMGGGVRLTNAVGAPNTHWGRFLFGLDQPHEVRQGSTITAHIRCDPSAQGGTETYWAVQIDDEPIECHDTRPVRAAALRRSRPA